MSAAEMVLYIDANQKRQLHEWKMGAQIGYAAGLIGSMSLAKSRPAFDSLFNFPKNQKTSTAINDKMSEIAMLGWAMDMNRRHTTQART